MSQVHALDFVHTAFVPSAPGGAPAQVARPLGAPSFGRPRVVAATATMAKLVFANLIGLAFILVLPFAGIAVLSWFAVRAVCESTA